MGDIFTEEIAGLGTEGPGGCSGIAEGESGFPRSSLWWKAAATPCVGSRYTMWQGPHHEEASVCFKDLGFGATERF